jgi:nitric oxide reductase activation protein
MKFLNFMEKKVDTFLQLMLSDLAKTLSRSPDLDVEFAFHSYYRQNENLVTVSHYWNDILDSQKTDGMKSDIYLRAFGNSHFTDYNTVTKYLSEVGSMNYPSFQKQLFCLIEDCRVEQAAVNARPGMAYAFNVRRDLLQKRYRERFSIHIAKLEWLDALFCAFYLQLTGKPVALPEPIAALKPKMRQIQTTLEHSKGTDDTYSLAITFGLILPEKLNDMKSSYLTIYNGDNTNHNAPDDLIEENQFKSSSIKKVNDKEDKETYDEKLPSWHEEQEHEGDNFLQFDLDQGTKTDLIGQGERKEESGDQAFASVQGSSQQSDGSQFDGDHLSSDSNDPNSQNTSKKVFGEANRSASEIRTPARKPTLTEQETYKTVKNKIHPIQKPLQNSIQKTIEQKKIAPRTDLHFGRLSKKLLRAVTDDNPRLFYKKDSPSTKLDVTFSLLVDCSASMDDKMDETKEGIVLFHETLHSLQIPHSITGFWEDAFEADDKEQPNHFLDIIRYEKSLLPQQGSSIMQLQPEEDNRDGFAIRKTVEELFTRQEKHKILLAFTDGEPSAFNYSDNGIVDTHESVLETRKKGIEVIGVFLSNGKPQEKEKETMRNIYGRHSLVIPTVKEIPGYITPLLKKLLLRYV